MQTIRTFHARWTAVPQRLIRWISASTHPTEFYHWPSIIAVSVSVDSKKHGLSLLGSKTENNTARQNHRKKNQYRITTLYLGLMFCEGTFKHLSKLGLKDQNKTVRFYFLTSAPSISRQFSSTVLPPPCPSNPDGSGNLTISMKSFFLLLTEENWVPFAEFLILGKK